MNLFERYRALRAAGVLGLNARNGEYISRHNPRRLYPRVDNKILSKRLLEGAGLPVPGLYAVISTQYEASHLKQVLEGRDGFVIKPANGSGGDGIVVIVGRKKRRFQKADGKLLSLGQLQHHVSGILSGMFSLGGHPDEAMVEALVEFDTAFEDLAWQGVPDVRVIVFLGYPAMAMTRLPTRASGGRANLHQGAVGVGIDIASGRTLGGTWASDIIQEHPDTGVSMSGVAIPQWDTILDMAARCYDVIGLGYLGVDIVLHRTLGPMILELNARPGLSIQLANRTGLRHRLEAIEAMADPNQNAGERVAAAREMLASAATVQK